MCYSQDDPSGSSAARALSSRSGGAKRETTVSVCGEVISESDVKARVSSTSGAVGLEQQPLPLQVRQ